MYTLGQYTNGESQTTALKLAWEKKMNEETTKKMSQLLVCLIESSLCHALRSFPTASDETLYDKLFDYPYLKERSDQLRQHFTFEVVKQMIKMVRSYSCYKVFFRDENNE